MDTRISIPLDDKKIKEVAEVITNSTSMKILNHLIDKEKTTGEISTDLDLPINTVDYNIKKLLKTGLIEKKSFWWSKKGKKMPTYCVSNKQIIITPNNKTNKIKYLGALLITGIGALLIKIFTSQPKFVYSDIATTAGQSAVMGLAKGTSSDIIANNIVNTVTYFPKYGFGFWFLLGAWLTILFFFIFTLISERRNKK